MNNYFLWNIAAFYTTIFRIYEFCIYDHFFLMHVSLQSLIKNAHEIRNWQTIQSIPNVQNHLPSYVYFLVWKAASLRYTSQYKEKTITILFHADFN